MIAGGLARLVPSSVLRVIDWPSSCKVPEAPPVSLRVVSYGADKRGPDT